jgi:radical SAM protein (TIGR01212 family)
VESTLDVTLRRVNRGHTYADSEDAILRTARLGIYTGAHLILGLPGERKEDILGHAVRLSRLPLSTLKLHQLQLIRNTPMAGEYIAHPDRFHLFRVEEYIDLIIDFLERISPGMAVERFVSQSPEALLLAPRWGMKNYIFTEKVRRRMQERGAYQGRLFRENP